MARMDPRSLAEYGALRTTQPHPLLPLEVSKAPAPGPASPPAPPASTPGSMDPASCVPPELLPLLLEPLPEPEPLPELELLPELEPLPELDPLPELELLPEPELDPDPEPDPLPELDPELDPEPDPLLELELPPASIASSVAFGVPTPVGPSQPGPA